MSIADYLPHRLLINRSLSKASADLRSHIRAYEIVYEQKMEQCLSEIEQAQKEKDRELDNIRQILSVSLANDAAFFQQLGPAMEQYADLYLNRQCLYKMRDVHNMEKQVLDEYRKFLRNQMDIIGEEIDLLEERKDMLAARAAIDDIRELIELTECGLIVGSEDDALSLLIRIAELTGSGSRTDRLTGQALQKLRSLLQERADLLPVIQYTAWTIGQKKQQHHQLYYVNYSDITGKVENNKKEIRNLNRQIKSLNRSLEEQAQAVRDCWAVPIARLNVRISSCNREKSRLLDEIREIGRRIECIKNAGTSDSDWDSLWEKKNRLKSRISDLKEELDSLRTERTQWYERQKMLYSLCRENHIYLIPGGKGKASDEYRFIDNRLNELQRQEEETKQLEQERFLQESALLQQQKQEQTSTLAAQIDNARKRQTALHNDQEQSLRHLEDCKRRDNRFFLSRMFSDTDEVRKANLDYLSVSILKQRADNRLNALLKENARVTADFDRKLAASQPRPYRPAPGELQEREGLEIRKEELLRQKEKSNDSQN